jgi:putative nucleotidyltransferase with HDIG domain
MKISKEIVKESARYASEYLSKNLDPKFKYHDLSHTMYVTDATEMICEGMNINSYHKKLLLVAAWFHDLGYTQQVENHEIAGATIAEKFLLEKNIDEEDVEIVKSCILSTRYPQEPTGTLQEILCDADMMHLSDKAFMDAGDLLRLEWELSKNKKYTDEEWYSLNIQFVSEHKYHTSYAIKNLDGHKNKNIKKLRSKLDSVVKKTEKSSSKNLAEEEKNRKNKDRLERGVETLFRTASSNHMRLSGMADNKAHILLSINSIIISIVLSVLAKKLTDATYIIIPTVILLCISLATIVFAVLTTKPKISKGVFTEEQISKGEVNLLFFGNFHEMELDKYEWAIKELMYDKEYLYKSMTKDIYFLGKILAAKYRYLNIGYKVFMYGLLSSVAAYAISFLLVAHH